MSGIFSDLLGTTRAYLKIGLTGVRLKNNTGNLDVRNSGDSADAAITASKVNVSGDSIEINSDAAGSAADWKYTLQRPAAGMSAAITLTLPVNDGTSGQVLQTDGDGILSWASAATTGLCDKIDTTTLEFGSSSPVTMFSTGAGDVIDKIQVIIDTPFDGTAPSASVGITGTASKYMAATDLDLKATAGTVFEVHPGLAAAGAEDLIITYSGDSSAAGSARFLVYYGTPA